MIRYNTDCPYCHDIFDQYCNLFKGYKNCDKSDCEVLKILKENDQLVKYCKELEVGFLNYKKNYKTKRQQVYEMEIKIKNLEKENEQLKQKIAKMKQDVEELKLGSEDVEMFLRTDELLRSWELAE